MRNPFRRKRHSKCPYCIRHLFPFPTWDSSESEEEIGMCIHCLEDTRETEVAE